MAKLKLPKGVKAEDVSVADFAVGGAMDPGDIRKMLGGVGRDYPPEVWKMLQEVFRPKDLSKVLPATESKVPGSIVGSVKGTQDRAFIDYLNKIAKELIGPSAVGPTPGPPAAFRAIDDILNPTALKVMDEQFAKNNPIFKQMEKAGMFRRGRGKVPVDPWLAGQE